MLAGCVAADLAFAATSTFAQARDVHAATCGGDVRAHWHGGPFFEYRRAVGAAPVGAPAHFRVAPLREIRRLSNAIECRGGLGMWILPQSVSMAVLAAENQAQNTRPADSFSD